jgi:regulator of chromosome condensation
MEQMSSRNPETAVKKRKQDDENNDWKNNKKINDNNNIFKNSYNIAYNNYNDNVEEDDDDLTMGSNNSNTKILHQQRNTLSTPESNGIKLKSIFKSPSSTGSINSEQSSQQRHPNRRIVKSRSKDDSSLGSGTKEQGGKTEFAFQENCASIHSECLQQLNDWLFETIKLTSASNNDNTITVSSIQQRNNYSTGSNTIIPNDESDDEYNFLSNRVDRPIFKYSRIVSEYLRLSRDYTRRYGCPIPTTITTGIIKNISTSARSTTTTTFAASTGNGGEVVPMGSDDGNQCALPPSTIVKTVGVNSIENDDDEDEEEAEKPTSVAPFVLQSFYNYNSRSFKSISAGGMHSVALSVDGTVYTWGSSDDGALGRESLAERPSGNNNNIGNKSSTSDYIALESEPGLVHGFTTIDGINEDGQIIQVVAGDSHILFLSLSGNVYQCGTYKDCDSGKFHDCDKNNKIVGSNNSPVHVSALYGKPVREVFTRAGFNAALLMDDTIVTWGFGCRGELARSANMAGTTGPNKEGMYTLTKEYFYDLTTGKPNLKIVKEQFLTPKPPIWADTVLRPKKQVIAVATGGYHLLVCARDNNDIVDPFKSRLYTSGLNNYGQLGHGDVYIDRHQLTLVTALEHEDITYVAAGEHHSLALNIHGTVLYSFGRGDYGQLGIGKLGTGQCQTSPVLVQFPPVPADIAVGSVNDNNNNKLPLQQRIVKIAAGDRHSMALTEDNTVYTWGFNETEPTGHRYVEGQDVVYPELLDIHGILKTKNNPVVKVYDISGGGQHSLVLVKRYTGIFKD